MSDLGTLIFKTLAIFQEMQCLFWPPPLLPPSYWTLRFNGDNLFAVQGYGWLRLTSCIWTAVFFFGGGGLVSRVLLYSLIFKTISMKCLLYSPCWLSGENKCCGIVISNHKEESAKLSSLYWPLIVYLVWGHHFSLIVPLEYSSIIRPVYGRLTFQFENLDRKRQFFSRKISESCLFTYAGLLPLLHGTSQSG